MDLSDFSPSQREVVTAGEGPLSVLAGPGSGKTTVLVMGPDIGRPANTHNAWALTNLARCNQPLSTRERDC